MWPVCEQPATTSTTASSTLGRQAPTRPGSWLAKKRYDAVLIGAGVRLVANNTLLFEAIVNAAHSANPECRFVFNYAPASTPDDIRRWYPNPSDPTPAR